MRLFKVNKEIRKSMNLLLTLLYYEFIMHTIKNHLILNEYQKIIYSEEGYSDIKYAKNT